MSVQLLINNVDYTKYADFETVEVNSNVVMTSDQMTVDINLRGELKRPSAGNEIKLLVGSNIEFGGVITQIEEDDLGGDLQYKISASSYEYWLDRHLVNYYFTQQPAGQMVTSIIGMCGQGQFTTNNVQATNTLSIPPIYFNYETVSSAVKKIADQIQYGWRVDYTKDIHFYALESFVSPLPNNSLYADGNTDVASWSDLRLTEDSTQLRTRVFLKGFKSRVSTPVTLTFTGDGNSTQWSLGYKPSYSKGDITVTVGGTSLTVKKDLVDGSPGQNTSDTSSAYINYSNAMARLNYAPASGVQIKVTMYYLADTILMRENPEASLLAQQRDGNGDGRYEVAHTDKALTNSTIDAANAKGDQLLYQYAFPILQAEFNSFLYGWQAGQYFYLRSKRRMGGDYDGFRMYVQSVKKTLVQAIPGGPVVMKYDVQTASVPYLT